MAGRINPIALYLFSLAATIGAYALYANFAVPLVEGEPNIISPSAVTDGAYTPPDLKKDVRHLFAEDAWELQPCKTLQTQQGIILCKDYLPDEDGQIDVFPFTMILGTNDEKVVPTVIRCLQQARIRFDGPLSLGTSEGGGSPKIERAILQGQVLVYRPPSDGSGKDAFEIATSNLQIEKQQISTLESVEFRVGPHEGRGSNLTIEFAQRSGSPNLASDFSSVEGIRSIHLASLKYLRVHPGASKTETQQSSNRVFDYGSHPLDINCRGAFKFNLEHNEAEFQNDVVVQQAVEGGDSLNCDRLRLTFAGESLAKADPMNPAPGQELEMEQILAVGNPAIMNMPSRETRITGKQLQYNVGSGEVLATNDDGLVSIVNKEFKFESVEIRYRSAADNSIGDLDAIGNGRLERTATGDDPAFTAAWKDGLSIRTEAGKKLISLDGQAKVAIQNETQIEAEHIKFRLWPVQKLAENGQPTKNWDYLPSSLSANGSVQIVSAEVVGTARQLTANWPDIPSPLTTLFQRSNQVTRHSVQRQQYSDSGVQDPNGQSPQKSFPATKQGAFGSRTDEAGVPTSKFLFDGDFVTVEFTDHSSKPKLGKLRIDGNVSVIESKPGSEQPLKIEGSSLHMNPLGKEIYRIYVGGNTKQLAKVETDSLLLQGTDINLDQLENKLWVRGKGQMELNPQDGNKPVGAEKMPSQIEVAWQGGMVFDGRNIYFEKDVMMKAIQDGNSENFTTPHQPASTKTQLTRTRSNVLNVTLAQPVDFRELSKAQSGEGMLPGATMEVQEIVLVSSLAPERRAFELVSHAKESALSTIPIVIEVQSYDSQNKLIEKQRFVAPSARIRPAEGTISAKGPGLIVSHRLGQKKNAFAPDSRLANQQAGQLSYLRVNYDGGVEANSKSEKLRIAGNIRALFVPTNDWNASLDPDQVVSIPAGGGKLACEQVEMEKWQTRGAAEPTTEFIASGNAHMWGDLFEATADRVSYNNLNDMLVIEGTPRTDANLWHQKNSSSARSHLVAGKIWYRPSDQETRVEKIKNASTSIESQPRRGNRK